MFQARLFFIVILFSAFVGVVIGERELEVFNLQPLEDERGNLKPNDHKRGRHEATREQVIANYEKRREHLSKLVARHQAEVEDHENGRSLLEDEDYAKAMKRIRIFGKKLERMEGPMEEEEIELMIEHSRIKAKYHRRDL
mmetsp:Transcript_8292/g.17917  ORF Transcript_8292/g.17917 Transcript_8292/m.17917 type:complete len:140 (-) Transcript_8292:83-502(-)|eukprot:CAMPEP_0168191834 /NCGR_PEP_ID=MMETSP0139_2-20121125/17727_1 /TAXON_ID=44445 /ORGANISM="Pseudo-nitzschia australis, Strain 10249 10 AB" /LENGTH=139 /DNA_ID=CAMNT_0008115035 /DNA_START=56 /DNA_END=475 /DNA_ORIENTATION=-